MRVPRASISGRSSATHLRDEPVAVDVALHQRRAGGASVVQDRLDQTPQAGGGRGRSRRDRLATPRARRCRGDRTPSTRTPRSSPAARRARARPPRRTLRCLPSRARAAPPDPRVARSGARASAVVQRPHGRRPPPRSPATRARAARGLPSTGVMPALSGFLGCQDVPCRCPCRQPRSASCLAGPHQRGLTPTVRVPVESRARMSGVGIDLLEIDRLETRAGAAPAPGRAAVHAPGARVRRRRARGPRCTLAARFCAKEAVAKALELDEWSWHDVEVARRRRSRRACGSAAPPPRARGELGAEVSLSLTHTRGMAGAVAGACRVSLPRWLEPLLDADADARDGHVGDRDPRRARRWS